LKQKLLKSNCSSPKETEGGHLGPAVKCTEQLGLRHFYGRA
jgi:hypothetical protein